MTPPRARAVPAQTIAFVVPGEPVPKARARVTRHATAYTPPRTVEAEVRVRQYLKIAYPHLRPAEGPFRVTLEFQFHGVGRGDWDNYAKLVCDALNGIVWQDDRQIRWATVLMRDQFADPCTIVTIEAVAA